MTGTVKIKKESSVKIAIVLAIGVALVFTAMATSLSYYNPVATAQQTNQTTSGEHRIVILLIPIIQVLEISRQYQKLPTFLQETIRKL